MKSQSDVANALEGERQRQKLKYIDLATATGLSVLAVRQALQGKTAVRITSMMALADRLGLEVMLLPKLVAGSMGGDGSGGDAPPVLTSVQQALERQRGSLSRAGRTPAGGSRP
jgi:transcriptional regulator with XRE-family HTH domain